MEKLGSFPSGRETFRIPAYGSHSGAILAGAQLFPLPERTALNAPARQPSLSGNVFRRGRCVFQAKPGFTCSALAGRPRILRAGFLRFWWLHGHFYERGSRNRVRVQRTRFFAPHWQKMGAVVSPTTWSAGEIPNSWIYHAHNVLQPQGFGTVFAPQISRNPCRKLIPERIGATGASGGATQIISCLAAAVDPRIHASMPGGDGFLTLHCTDPCRTG